MFEVNVFIVNIQNAINEDFSAAFEEYEYLLSPNQEFETLNIDSENHIIDIILV